MECQSLSIPQPVSRKPARRLIEVLRIASHRLAALWQRWKQRQQDDSVLETLALLDAHTLKDIGIPEDFRSRAAALHEARRQRFDESMR